MGVNKFNSEGYYDPTPYAAITNVIKGLKTEKNSVFKPLVYICSTYSGNIEINVKKARAFCRFALEMNRIPLAPHLLFPQFMNDDIPQERELAMFMNMVLLGKCNELWVFGNTISNGMAQEIERAKKRKQLIRYFNEKLQEVDSL
ncbi:DUF4406 domain-containing protein [Clostridium tyrobutyricum]|uniref:DUF7768 domain-containing protein n=1 Tax=Clostridium tyrobutyricum DIVETGP TaxID=1408889 RepID=W6NAA0_CLOTY|nr:DUF4406 domain-containing protein [Clostridium tyrobutyricum]AND85587.1 hypothetical protein CTK_C23390 [Clostridium tyrobutyricum]ANP70113.1 DUF4406 domain-containing protein [Clostridium tyrobutyricum]MBV4433739.1 DUF4406 domain-containing protein [Clostridium tyrobutyricum]QNB65526.1 DUF4406 domain-containing protein [Clostridium tyrobutyricum]CDL92489.1 FIG00520233: hypothetical protein [Clostridium tyrobutyricum DIVETGP]